MSSFGSESPRSNLAKVIPRRPRVTWMIGIVFALVFAVLVTPAITAERWLLALGMGEVVKGQPVELTVRVPAFGGIETAHDHVSGGGVFLARGEVPSRDDVPIAQAIIEARPRGPLPYIAIFMLAFVFVTIFTHHMRRSTQGRLVRVQIVSLVAIALLAIAAKGMLLGSALSALVVPVALLAMVPTMVLDRIVGLATGVLAALVVGLLGPFDLGVAVLMLVQASTAGLVVAERPKLRWKAALAAGLVTTLFTAATYVLLTYLTTGELPPFGAPLRTPWLAAAIGPAIAMVVAVPLIPLYQLLVGEITQGKLVELEDLSNPLLRQIADRAPGTWQHSLMMANMAEIAANTIGANGRLVRVGAYYHDLGKSLTPKYFIENLERGEPSPHDQLPPEVSCDAIFAHVTEGIVTARKAGLHERIVDFMHMHHGDGVLEYFWGKCREQGNANELSIERFRYPGHPPQSRETAILAICDAVEAASRTLKKPEPAAIETLVVRIVYGKLHLGQLDESGLSMSDLRRVSESLRETIRHANHGRIEYPWQKAEQDASASQQTTHKPISSSTEPRLDSLDRKPGRAATSPAMVSAVMPIELGAADRKREPSGSDDALAIAQTADLRKQQAEQAELAIVETAPALGAERRRDSKQEPPSASHQGEWPAVSTATVPPVSERFDVGEHAGDEVPAGALPELTPSGRIPLPDGIITPSTFAGVTPPVARKRAATLPPIPAGQRRAPTVHPPPLGPPRSASPSSPPPNLNQTFVGTPTPAAQPGMSTLPGPSAPARLPATPPPAASNTSIPGGSAPAPRPSSPSATPTRDAGPPVPTDLENAVTNPPPFRRGPSSPPPGAATRLPGIILGEDQRVTAPLVPATPITYVGHVSAQVELAHLGSEETVLEETILGHGADADDGAHRTEPSMPKFELPLRAPPTNTARSMPERVEAAVDPDEWQTETPIKPPTKAELRALLGVPDPTRKQSIDELEALHRAVDSAESEPELFPRRYPSVTEEVDPDDIESAIELAPPARNRAPSAIAFAKPKKSE
jgi:hypothetical protein